MLYRWSYIVLTLGLILVSCTSVVDELSSVREGSFSIVIIPDTHMYKGRGPKSKWYDFRPVSNPVFDAHTKWIVDNLESQRIAFVSHVGDIVDLNIDSQWIAARESMDRLHGKVPYGISVGNHDMTSDGDSSLFQNYFGAQRFESMPWYGGFYESDSERVGHSGNGANSYQLFTAEGISFIALHLETNAPKEVLLWADMLLKKYENHWAIVTTHMYLGPLEKPKSNEGYFNDPKGVMRWTKIHGDRGTSGQQMWDTLFSKHPNIFMIISGDQRRTTALYLKQTGAKGRDVHSILTDYRSRGPLRIYRVTPAKGTIEAITYDTTLGKLVDNADYAPGRENHQFTFHHDFSLLSRGES